MSAYYAHEKAQYLQRQYERRDSLKRILERKTELGQDTTMILELIELNEADIALAENGSGMDWETEAAVNAGFMAMNGL